MAWEDLSDIIKRRVEKIKRDRGYITAEQLDTKIYEAFNSLRENDMFLDDFQAADSETLTVWLQNIRHRLKSVIVTTIDPDNVIDQSKDYKRWIDKRDPKVDWRYFQRYHHYLRKLNRPADVIQNLEFSTRAIIERLGDPLEGIDELQKGLVLGSVQSGKTANFNGVINRAIDAGYDMIIVFSGIMEDLRIQTQKRINHDVIGLGEIGNQINQDVGVGVIHKFGKDGFFQINSITTTFLDFKKSMVESHFDFTNQRILVCKKNVSVLTNLIYWLKSSLPTGSEKLQKSLLVIDDEADNASLNNLGHKGAEYASKVNGHIRAMINLFRRRSYLGYTATPFANILQDQHCGMEESDAWIIPYRYQGQQHEIRCSLSPGLFPDNFIYKLATPSNYLGPRRFFSTGREKVGDQKIPLIETIPAEGEDGEVIFGEEGYVLRRSLADAVDCFVLSIALRYSRNMVLESLPGYTGHHTMLVHVSRLIIDQNSAADRISKYVAYLMKKISSDSINDPGGIYSKFQLQWNRFFAFKVANIKSFLPHDYNSDGLVPCDWEDISALLPDAVKNIAVKAINSSTGEKLIYPDTEAKKYIAVGGNRLSRGFTLEGLTINYFLRDTNLYDALLQMGRWFGYRPGYIDACRLFIDAATEDKYNFITSALCELEEQIENMEVQKKSPKEFELRIRKHPDVLQITRSSILKNAAEVRYSFQDMVQQSVHFQLEKKGLEKSWNDFKHLRNEIAFTTSEDKDFYTYDGSTADLFRFLDLPTLFVPSSFPKEDLKSYILLSNDRGKLTNWKIAIRRSGLGRKISEDNLDLNLTRRSGARESDPTYYPELRREMRFTASGKSMNIMTSGRDEAVGLSKEVVEKAISEFREFKRRKFLDAGDNESEAKRKALETTVPGWIFRKERPETQGLLLIYLIDLKHVFHNEELKHAAREKGIDILTPLVGYVLSFPQIDDDAGAIYLANETVQSNVEDEVYEDGEIPDDFTTTINDIV